MIELISQTWEEDGLGLGDVLGRVLSTGDYRQMDVATAYATGQGVKHLLHLTESLRQGGGKLRLFLGVDGNATTREALENLLRGGVPTWVVGNSNLSTRYHPKVYFIEGREQSVVALGSHNLTTGGLYRNYEASLLVRLNPADPESDGLTKQLRDFFSDLSSISVRLTSRLLGQLERRGVLSSDDTSREPIAMQGDAHATLADIFPTIPVRRPPVVPSGRTTESVAAVRRPARPDAKDAVVQNLNLLNASFYLQFSTEVLRRLSELGRRHSVTPRDRSYVALASGVGGFASVAEFLDDDRCLFALLYIDTGEKDRNKRIFDKLRHDAKDLERELGVRLEWRRLNHRRACRVLVRSDWTADSGPENLHAMSAWAAENIVLFERVFLPRIKRHLAQDG